MHQSQLKRKRMVMLVVLGLVAGGALGLLASRAIKSPLHGNTLAHLPADAKEEYVLLVAGAYCVDHDLDRAHARLEQLEAPNIEQWIAHLVDRYLAEERDAAGTLALVELADGLGVKSQPVLAYLATLTPQPTDTPSPIPTQAATRTSTPTRIAPTETPTASASPEPSDTAQPLPSDPPEPSPSHTSNPQPTNTPRPQASNTPQPSNTPAAKWSWVARLVGPGQEGQSCAEGHKLIRVTVLDAAGQQIQGVWVHEKYTGQYRVTGHKGDDPYWGPGEAEFSNLDGGQLCMAGGEGGACESELTRTLPCHDPPPFEDLWAAGYCECCEPGIAKERCRELFETGKCLGISHYAWRVEFRRSW
jgi:hypothetical protein